MKHKTVREIFGEVDPNLKIVPGGRHWKISGADWLAAGGAFCSRCKKEALWFRPEDGVCKECTRFLDEKYWSDKKKHTKVLRFVKAHNARIRKRGR